MVFANVHILIYKHVFTSSTVCVFYGPILMPNLGALFGFVQGFEALYPERANHHFSEHSKFPIANAENLQVCQGWEDRLAEFIDALDIMLQRAGQPHSQHLALIVLRGLLELLQKEGFPTVLRASLDSLLLDERTDFPVGLILCLEMILQTLRQSQRGK